MLLSYKLFARMHLDWLSISQVLQWQIILHIIGERYKKHPRMTLLPED